MNVTVTFHKLAEAELHEAIQYYESAVWGLGAAFLAEVERSIAQIRAHPEAAPFILKVVRRKILPRFPYVIMYSVVDDTIYVLAVANQKRRPFYWQQRQ
jgi:toxin ParE1/3/4